MTGIRRALLLLLLLAVMTAPLCAQVVNASQAVVVEGLLSNGGHGAFNAAAYEPDGSLVLLVDERDGVRLMKTDGAAANVLAQAHVGAAGDAGLAMALDPAGNVYVTGTSTSGTLAGTSGAAFPARADNTTNSFVAKFDANLKLGWLTFLGAGKTAAASVAATTDGVFVTGVTFGAGLPVTARGIQQTAASGSSENGFVERFSADGTTLVYATYLTGLNGNTMPAAIAADASDNAYVAGATTSSGFPTIAALQPEILGATSGFLVKLAPQGSSLVFSTFVAGSGLTSVALDAADNMLLLAGNVSLGQFPVAAVAMPLTSASYQTMLRVPVDGQSVAASVLLVPGTQSFVSAGPGGTAWVAGALATPLFPGEAPPDYDQGDSFLLHVTGANAIDQTLRVGGLAVDHQSYASLTSVVAAPAVSADGKTAALPGTITAAMSNALLATERFDLPLVGAPTSALPNTMRDVVPTAAACGSMSQCTGSGGLLTIVETAQSAASLGVAADDAPNVTLRNLGSTAANGIAVTASGFTQTNDCGALLAASSQCSVALTGSGPGSVTASAANAGTNTQQIAANALAPDALALSTYELDFGIVSAASGAVTRALTVTNLTGAAQTFTAARDAGPAVSSYTIAVSSSDCASGGAAGTFVVAANAACHLAFSMTASGSSANDGAVRTAWLVGARDVVLTGFAQAAAVNVSASEVDFGTQFTNGIKLPRYLYLSNNSNSAVAHAKAALPASSPFTVNDQCPSTLDAHSVCGMTITYASASAPSADTATLTLDNGASVLLTGTTMPAAGVTGSAANPSLSVSPSSISFATPVVVTGVSTGTQTVTVTNTGAVAFSLAIAASGDFKLTNGCGSTLGAGASCQVLVSFAPSQPGARDGVLSVTAGSGFAPAYVALNGTGLPLLPANNGTLNLGQTLAGEPIVQWYQVQQSLTTLTVATGDADFGVVLLPNTGSVPATPAPGAFTRTATGACSSCWLGVQFLSQAAGADATTMTMSTVAQGNPYVVMLSATALPVTGLVVSPVTADFGPVAVNSTAAPMVFTLTNLLSPSADTTVTSVTATGDFAVVQNSTGGPPCPGVLSSTASCFVEVQFAPTAIGQRTGTLTIATANGSATASLVGYGLSDPGIAIRPEALVFSAVPNASATQQTVTLTNTGAVALTIGTVTASSGAFAVSSGCGTLAPGASCAIQVMFTPQAAPVSAAMTIPVTETVNGQTITTNYAVALTGAYTAQDAGLEILPSQANFGSTAAGSVGQTQTFTLTNLTAKALNVTLQMPRQFAQAVPGQCPTLAPAASCTFGVTFLPETAGELTGTVFAQGAPADGSAQVQALAYMLGYGSSSGALVISGLPVPNAPLSFGQVTSGQSLAKTLTVTNTGSVPMTVRRVTSEPPFLAATTCGAALAVGASCTVTVTYAPVDEVAAGSSAGPRTDTGSVVIESDAASSPDVVDLSGTVGPIVSGSPATSAAIVAYSLSQGSLTFAQTAVGSTSAAQMVTLTNTGTTALHFGAVMAPADFAVQSTCGVQLPGTKCALTVTFAPQQGSATVREGAIEIASDAAVALEFISVLGTSTPAPVTVSPAALNFGTVNVGGTGTLPVTVTNTGSAAVTMGAVTATGDYSAGYGTCPVAGGVLAGGASCTLSVSFAPTGAGARTGMLSVSTSGTSGPLTVSLTGIGAVTQLTVSTGALAFGSINVGASANQTLTLTNTGTTTITGIATTLSGANANDFAVTGPCTATLAAGASCTVTVMFTPGAAGARVATLSVVSSDPSSPAVVALSGTGAQAGTFTLTVGGGSSATVTVAHGVAATYQLALTPQNGFTGTVALTCTPVVPAQYATCSLLPSSLTVSGTTAQSSTATITTLTQISGLGPLVIGVFGGPLLAMVIAGSRRRRSGAAAAVAIAVLCGAIAGCGGKSAPATGGGGGGGGTLEYTPAGTYQYTVTATSTSGPQVTSTVTLNLVVQ